MIRARSIPAFTCAVIGLFFLTYALGLIWGAAW